MSTNKNAQFQGFAKLLYGELKDAGYTAENYDPDQSVYRDDAIELIARRAYSLVEHVYYFQCFDHIDFAVRNTPDMTAWPEGDNNEQQ